MNSILSNSKKLMSQPPYAQRFILAAHNPAKRKNAVSISEKITAAISGCALMAAAGFSIITKGCMQSQGAFDAVNAMPLKKPATPIPRVTHISGDREDIKIIKDNTGMDVIYEYPAKASSVLKANVPCGKYARPMFVSVEF